MIHGQWYCICAMVRSKAECLQLIASCMVILLMFVLNHLESMTFQGIHLFFLWKWATLTLIVDFHVPWKLPCYGYVPSSSHTHIPYDRLYIPCWWFGTCFIFPYDLECHHPNWRSHIFQRAWNHQPDTGQSHKIPWKTTIKPPFSYGFPMVWQHFRWWIIYIYINPNKSPSSHGFPMVFPW